MAGTPKMHALLFLTALQLVLALSAADVLPCSLDPMAPAVIPCPAGESYWAYCVNGKAVNGCRNYKRYGLFPEVDCSHQCIYSPKKAAYSKVWVQQVYFGPYYNLHPVISLPAEFKTLDSEVCLDSVQGELFFDYYLNGDASGINTADFTLHFAEDVSLQIEGASDLGRMKNSGCPTYENPCGLYGLPFKGQAGGQCLADPESLVVDGAIPYNLHTDVAAGYTTVTGASFFFSLYSK